MEVPAPEAVAAMAPEDVRQVLTNCPESPKFMHDDIGMSDEQARVLAFNLAVRWHVRRIVRLRDRLIMQPKRGLEPILEINDEAK